MTEYAQSGFDVEAYLSKRPRYPDRVYELLEEYREKRDGSVGGPATLLDLGCGPGMASWPLLDRFDQLVGLDPGLSMIDTARKAYAALVSARPDELLAQARFEVLAVEHLDTLGLADGSVDCAIAATAAHWFDMHRTYAHLAKLVRSGGTLAMWTYDLAYPSAHASTVSMVSRFAYEDLKGFVDIDGSRRIRSLYAELDLPEGENWTDIRYVAYPNGGKSGGYLPVIPAPTDELSTPPQTARAPIETTWDPRLHTSGVVSWDDLTAGKRTNSSYFNWRNENPDVPREQDIAACQVRALRQQVLDDRRAGIGADHAIDDEHVEIMRPMGMLLMRRR